MEQLRKKLKSIELLTHLRDRKSKQLEIIRESNFYSVFGNEESRVLDLKSTSIDLQRIDIKINIKLNELNK